MGRRCVVLFSGGVDSSVALSEAVERYGKSGVLAVYLKIFAHEEERDFFGIGCTSDEDLRYVENTTQSLGVELSVLSLQEAYYKAVVERSLEEVKRGYTPNPDILCNSEVKFGVAMERLGDMKYSPEIVVTGHYARVMSIGSGVRLLRARDAVKDQTYFLSRLSHEQLRGVWFPLGRYKKSQVRDIAKKKGLMSAERSESQGVCFLGKFQWRDFLKYHVQERPGEIRDIDTGLILGEHRGLHYYTYGQRKGFSLPGGPWYVRKKDLQTQTLYVQKKAPVSAGRRSVSLRESFWREEPQNGGLYRSKIRHGPHEIDALYFSQNEGKIRLQKPERGLSPGQSLVLYDDEVCLGGGVIDLYEEG